MQNIPSVVGPGHPDYADLTLIKDELLRLVGSFALLEEKFPTLVRQAIDFVLDPVRTARTQMADLDNIEKTFVGLKIEHFLRDMLDAPPGLLRDLQIGPFDVDVKNTVRETWMIPPETYLNEDPCLLVASDEITHQCWLGLFLARDDYLTKPNRDKKRGVGKKSGFPNIMWLIESAPYPRSHWTNIDMKRFRELRELKPGSTRAATFLEENQRVPIHRAVLESLLFDQKDPMKRTRENGGARDILNPKGIAVLSGVYDQTVLKLVGFHVSNEYTVCATPIDAQEAEMMRHFKAIA